MKKIGMLLAIVGALVFSSVAFAAGGSGGGGLNAHMARIDAKITAYESKCGVTNPPAKCAAAKVKLTGRLTRFENQLDGNIAKAEGARNAAKVTKLTTLRNQVATALTNLP